MGINEKNELILRLICFLGMGSGAVMVLISIVHDWLKNKKD